LYRIFREATFDEMFEIVDGFLDIIFFTSAVSLITHAIAHAYDILLLLLILCVLIMNLNDTELI
jgi:hypothetical protein